MYSCCALSSSMPTVCRRPPRPYLASFDISRAFDGVPTDQLLRLAGRLLARPAYTIVKYSEARPDLPFQRAGL
jgi:hypothetical protein